MPDPIASTPRPPYVAVVFTSVRTPGDHGYAAMSAAMDDLAAQQPGFLGVESVREPAANPGPAGDVGIPGDVGITAGVGITVSYWATREDAAAWKQVAAHLVAQRRGREAWYADYRVRVAVVERDHGPGDDHVR